MHIFLSLLLLFNLFGCSAFAPCSCDCSSQKAQNSYKRVDTPIIYKKRVKKLRSKAKRYWGNKAKVASPYQYVKYAKNFKARTIIDFAKGTVRVETTVAKHHRRLLKDVIATTLLSTQDPERIDLFSSRNIVQVGEPFLHNRVKDFEGKAIRWQWRAQRYAQYLLDKGVKKSFIKTGQGKKRVYYVSFKMQKQRFSRGSKGNYASIVRSMAKRFGLNPALIFALIETESHFNPFASSAIPAYGLMQVVPNSAGRDAWKFLTKRKGKPTRNYLFNAKNNIEMGSAYVYILFNRYLSKIKNPKSREYCVIAAYNTGSGNVLGSFHKSRKRAFARINALSPEGVFYHLRKKLPYKETRNYISKVSKAKKRYQ